MRKWWFYAYTKIFSHFFRLLHDINNENNQTADFLWHPWMERIMIMWIIAFIRHPFTARTSSDQVMLTIFIYIMIRATITLSRKREKDKMPKAYEMKNNLAFIWREKKNFSLFSFVAYLIIMIVHWDNKEKRGKFSCMWQRTAKFIESSFSFFFVINRRKIKLLQHQH